MAWSLPVTWVDGQVVDASDLNEQLRDNLNYLLAPNVVQVYTATGTLSTTGTTFANVGTAWSKSLTLNGGYLHVGGKLTISGGDLTDIALAIAVDGTPETVVLGGIPRTNFMPINFTHFATGLASGAHTVALQWRIVNTPGHTAWIVPHVNPLNFWAKEA